MFLEAHEVMMLLRKLREHCRGEPSMRGVAIVLELIEKMLDAVAVMKCPRCGSKVRHSAAERFEWEGTDEAGEFRAVSYICSSCGQELAEARKYVRPRWDG